MEYVGREDVGLSVEVGFLEPVFDARTMNSFEVVDGASDNFESSLVDILFTLDAKLVCVDPLITSAFVDMLALATSPVMGVDLKFR